MFTFDLLVILALFLVSLAANLAVKKRIRNLLGSVAMLLIAVSAIRYFTAIRYSASVEQSTTLSPLMAIAVFLPKFIARPYLKRQAGSLILQLPTSGALALSGFISGAMLILLILRSVFAIIVGSSYFNPIQSPSILPMYIMLGLLAASGLDKTEIRELGILRYGILQNWAEFKSHAWSAPQAQRSETKLILQPKSTSFLARPVKLDIPTKYQEAVAVLVAKQQ